MLWNRRVLCGSACRVRWFFLAALACSGCAGRAAPGSPPKAVARADEAEPRQDGEDSRLVALAALRTKLEQLLSGVDEELRSLCAASPASSAEPGAAPSGAARRAREAEPEGDAEPGVPERERRIAELLDQQLVITVALARVARATARRRVELGLELERRQRGSARQSRAAVRMAASVAASSVDPATARLAAILQDAELAVDEAKRWRDRGRTADGRFDSDLPQQDLARDDRNRGPHSGKGRAFELGAGGADDGILDGLMGGMGGGKKKDKVLPAERKLEESGRGDDADFEDEPIPSAPGAPRRKAARTPSTQRGGWFGGEGESGGSSRRASVVVQGPPPAGVMSAVQRRLGGMLDCIPAADRAAGPVRFRVTARLTPDGQLREPVLRSGGQLAPTVEACLVDQLRRVQAPATEDSSSRVVAFPVWLSSE